MGRERFHHCLQHLEEVDAPQSMLILGLIPGLIQDRPDPDVDRNLVCACLPVSEYI